MKVGSLNRAVVRSTVSLVILEQQVRWMVLQKAEILRVQREAKPWKKLLSPQTTLLLDLMWPIHHSAVLCVLLSRYASYLYY